jgi:hypothetical protein
MTSCGNPAQEKACAVLTKRRRGALLSGTAALAAPAVLALTLSAAQAQPVWFNNGTINHNSGTRFGDVKSNAGTINNNPGATWNGDVNSNSGLAGWWWSPHYQAGTINNGGTWNGDVISNAGTINNNRGATWNGDVIFNAGLIGQWWSPHLQGGTINNSGTWNGDVGSFLFPNIGTINNSGTWNGDAHNAGFLNNYGTWKAYEVTNAYGGRVNNDGWLSAHHITNTHGGVIDNDGLITAGHITNESRSAIFNNGAIFTGSLKNDNALVVNDPWSVIWARHDITNKNGGEIFNRGWIAAGGDITNKTGGLIKNGGWVTTGEDIKNESGGTIVNFRHGWIGAAEDITNNDGKIVNKGLVTAGGDITNENGGKIFNHGWILAGGDITNNNAKIVNKGLMAAGDDIINENGGKISNRGWILAGGDITNNDAKIANKGVMAARGDINNENGGKIFNRGRIWSGDDITNINGGTIINKSSGVITARGDIKNENGSLIVNSGEVKAHDDIKNKNDSVIVNTGLMKAHDDIKNENGSLIVNTGLMKAHDDIKNENGSAIFNSGLMKARDDIKNEKGSLIVNSGEVKAGGDLVNVRHSAIVNLSGGEIDVDGNIYNGRHSLIYNGQGAVINAGDVYNRGRIVNNGTFNDDLFNAGLVINNGAFNANAVNFGALVNNNTWTGTLNNAGFAAFNNGSQWNGTVNNGGTVQVSGTANVNGAFNNGTFLGNNSPGVINLAGASPTTSTLNITGAFNANPGFSLINTTSDLSTVPGAAGKVASSAGNSGTTFVDVNRAAGSVVVLGNRTSVIKNTGGAGTGTLEAAATPDSTAVGSFGLVNVTLESGGNGNWDLVRRLNVGAAAAPGAGILGALTAVESGFQQSAPYVASSQNQNPDTWTAGVWSRVGGGQMTIKSTAQDALGGNPASLRVKTTYDAYEVGVDTGRLNFSNGGWNGHFGVLGGSMSATADEQLTGTNVKVDAPFAGAYGVLVNGPVALNLVGRYNWIDTHVTDAAANLLNASLNGHSFNVAASGSYNIALQDHWFVAPMAGISFTQAELGQLATNVGQQSQGIAAGSISYDTLTSALFHAGARFGTTFQATDNLVLQPFGTLSVWHEMAGNWGATFAQQGGLADQFNLGRAGTYGQAGLGVVAQVPNSGFSGFARGDVQFGDKVDGTSVVGGLRYNFGP